MIWTVAGILLLLWLAGLLTGTLGNAIHLLLLVALAVFAFKLITGRK